MIRNLKQTRFGLEGEIDFPLINCEMGIMIDEGISVEYAEKCVEHLHNLSADMIKTLSEGCVAYCEDSREYFDEAEPEVPENITADKILDYVSPGTLIVDEECDGIGYHIELGCDWEIEHGLEWTIRDNMVLYVGSFNDMRAHSEIEYYKDDICNYIKFD